MLDERSNAVKAKSMAGRGCVLVLVLLMAAAVTMAPGLAPKAYADDVEISETNFPDSVFRSYVSGRFDTDHNGYLSSSEISNAKGISIQNNTLSDLKGIEYLTALDKVYCKGNRLTSIDVSRNTVLTELDVSRNKLTSIDVSRNTALKDLKCGNNSLTSLDVSRNTALENLSCSQNKLTELDVSNNTALQFLWCFGNQLTGLDVSRNTALTFLHISKNQLTSLDVSRNTALKDLYCSNNQLTDIDVTNNPNLKELLCYNNPITSLDVTQNPSLHYLYCNDDKLTSLDLSGNTELIELRCYNNQLTDLDVSRNPDLTRFECQKNQLTSLDLSAQTSLPDNFTALSTQSRTIQAIYGGGKLAVDLAGGLGIDMSRASDVSVTGGTYSGGKAYFDMPLASGAKITYNYDTQNANLSKKMNVTLNVEWAGHALTHHDRVEPTCTEKGREEYWTCRTCGCHFADDAAAEEVTDLSVLDIPALGHDFSAAWDFDDTCHWHVCSRCGIKSEAEAHTFGAWKYSSGNAHVRTVSGTGNAVKQTAAAGSGEKERTCSECGYVEKQEIAAVTPAEPAIATGSGLVKTGDDSNAAFCVFLMTAAAGAGILIRRRSGRGRN